MEWKKIGQVGKAQGLKGYFFISGRSSLLSAAYSTLKVGKDLGSAFVSEVEDNTVIRGRTALKISGIDDRSAVEQHKGAFLFAPEDVEEHELSYLHGSKVVDVDGVELGVVQEFYNFGGPDNVEVVNESGHTLQIPFVENYVDLRKTQSQGFVVLNVSGELFLELWDEKG